MAGRKALIRAKSVFRGHVITHDGNYKSKTIKELAIRGNK
jgi:hypothetical protein